MEAGRRFHDLAAAAGNERSPRVDLERLDSEMTYNVLMGTLNRTYSLTHYAAILTAVVCDNSVHSSCQSLATLDY